MLLVKKECEAASIQKEKAKNESKGSPEALQKIMFKMIERGTEKSIQRDLSLAKSDQLKQMLKDLDEKREALENQMNAMQPQTNDGVEILQIRVAEDQLKLRDIGLQIKVAEREFGPGHPQHAKLQAQFDAGSKQLNLREETLKERQAAVAVLARLETELSRCRDQTNKAAQQYQELLIQQHVADCEKDLVEAHSAKVRAYLSNTTKVLPALESQSQALNEELRMLREEKLSIDAKIRNLQPVVVEFW